MPNLPDQKLLDAKTHVLCMCMNVIPLESVHCPYCKRFNAATTAEHCPTCSQSLKNQQTIDTLVLKVQDLTAEIAALKAAPPAP